MLSIPIRRRAGQNELKAGLTQDEMRHKIRHNTETAFEGLRYFEMKKWHIFLDEIENIKIVSFYLIINLNLKKNFIIGLYHKAK